MKTLIMKERKILFYTNLLNIAVTFLMMIPYAIFRTEGNFDTGLILIIWLSTYINVGESIEKGNKSNDDILLGSMPIERGLIVKSKYVSVLLMILNALVIFASIVILTMATFNSGRSVFEILNIGKIIVTVSIVLFSLSFSLSAYYSKKGVEKKKSTGLDLLVERIPFLFFILFMWKGRGDTYFNNILLKLDSPIFVILIFIISLLFYFISYLISHRIYRKTEF